MVLVALALTACGERHPGCDQLAAEVGLQAIAEARPEVAEVADRMRIYCVDDTRGQCLHDVAGCTPWIGSPMSAGKVVAKRGVPLDALLRHEAEHWYLWPSGACPSHEAACGWRWDRVESP